MLGLGHTAGNGQRPEPAHFVHLLLGCVLIAAAVYSCSGCASQTGPRVTDVTVPFSPEEQQAWSAVSKSSYRLDIGDIITIDFKFMNEMDQRNVNVLPDGTISVVGLENIHVQGLTLVELDSIATTAYAADIRDPELTIVVESIGHRLIYVLGEVRHPGSYDISNGQPGLFQSISMAGGFSDGANTKEVVVARVTPDGFQYRLANLSDLNTAHTMELAMLDIRPNDIIYVPRSGLGDLRYFSQTFLSSALSVTGLFWDVWAIAHIDQVDRLYR